jgi:hypothetical protein
MILKLMLKEKHILVGAEYIGFRIGTRGWPLVNTVMNLGIS